MDPGDVQTRRDVAVALTLLRERQGLSVRDVSKASGVGVSTLGGWFSGRHLPPMSQLDQLDAVLRACSVEDADVREAWREAVARVRRSPRPRSPTAVPYRGLASFGPEHAAWFFGRDGLVEVLLRMVVQAAEGGGGLVWVVGVSGSGKSSVVQAGLIPRLAGTDDRHRVTMMRPGSAPRLELERVLGPTASGRFCGPGVLVVDQFEELFTECQDEGEREAFLQALAQSVAPAPGAVPGLVVVAGLRADFYPHVLSRGLVRGRQEHQVAVGAMSLNQLREVIEAPARAAHVDLDEGLVEVLLNDLAPVVGAAGVGEQPGTLPLLSHALLATWERGRGARMTVADYTSTGGIRGAIAATAESVYSTLNPSQARAARSLFRRLVCLGDDSADTRRRVTFDELGLAPGQPTANGQLSTGNGGDFRPAVEAFAAQRLLTLSTQHVEITHEALLVAWPRLQEWLEVDRSGLRSHRLLTQDAHAWKEADADSSLLYRGTRLELAAAWATEPHNAAELNPDEKAFLDAGLEQRVEEHRLDERRARWRHRLVAALAVLLLATTGLAGVAFRIGDTAAHYRDLALSRQVAAASARVRPQDAALAAQLAVVAKGISATPEARAALLDATATPTPARLLGPPGVLQAAAASGDGRLLAGAGEAGVVRLWRTRSGRAPVRVADLAVTPGRALFALTFTPDGHTLASAGADRRIHLFDLDDATAPGPAGGRALDGPRNTVYSLAFSPDGALLAAGSATVGSTSGTCGTTLVPYSSRALPGPRTSFRRLPSAPMGGASRQGARTGMCTSGPSATILRAPAGSGPCPCLRSPDPRRRSSPSPGPRTGPCSPLARATEGSIAGRWTSAPRDRGYVRSRRCAVRRVG
jgi:hypothetical protein